MKKLFSFALTLCLMMPATFLAATPAPPPPSRCPRIHEAIHALEVAMKEMESARWDFCGDKVEAMRSTREALEHLRKAEQCKDCQRGDRDRDDHDRH